MLELMRNGLKGWFGKSLIILFVAPFLFLGAESNESYSFNHLLILSDFIFFSLKISNVPSILYVFFY